MADYINPSNYPFVDFWVGADMEIADYVGPYGTGNPLALKELIEIANTIGRMNSARNWQLIQIDHVSVDKKLNGGGDELTANSTLPICLLNSFKSLDDEHHNDSLRGRVFSTAPSEHAFMEFDPTDPDWEYGVLEKFGTLKDTWATDGYVYSQTYSNQSRGELGIKCFKAGEPLWHAPFDAMKIDLQGIEAIWTGAEPTHYGQFVDNDGNLLGTSAYKFIMACSVERPEGGVEQWKVDSTLEQKATGYKYQGQNGVFDVSAFNVPWANGVKYNSIVKQIAIPIYGGVEVFVELGDPNNPDRTDIIFSQDYIGSIRTSTTSGGEVWSKLSGYAGKVTDVGMAYVDGAFGTIQQYSPMLWNQARYEIWATVSIGYGSNAAIF